MSYSMAVSQEAFFLIATSQLEDSLSALTNKEDPLSQNHEVEGQQLAGSNIQPLTQEQLFVLGNMEQDRGPLWLVHVGANHKLIRYNIVIFGGVDGYSRKVDFADSPLISQDREHLLFLFYEILSKWSRFVEEQILYLNAATNNRASTAYGFFRGATKTYGVPSRVRGNQGVENIQIATFMISVRGTDRGSYISEKCMYNHRIRRLWRDVRVMVTNKYCELLYSLETDGLLDISSTKDLFCVHHIVLPRLQTDLEWFARVWNYHPLRTERSWSPEKLWVFGLMNTDVTQPAILEEPDVDSEMAADYGGEDQGAVLEFECPLSPDDLSEIQSVFEQTDRDTPIRELYLRCREYVAAKCSS